MTHRLFIAFLCFTAFLAAASAQSADAPATAPARQAVIIPPGFKSVSVGHRTALVEPQDEQWVKQMLVELQEIAVPSTMPSDILQRLDANRAALKSRMAADLALSDAAVVDTFISQKLEASLRKLEHVHAPLFFLVATRQRLKELLQAGWSDPHLYYNRAADDVQFDPRFNLAAANQTDDLLVPAVYAPDATLEQKRKSLSDTVRGSEATVVQSVSARAMSGTQQAFVEFMVVEVVGPLNLKNDKEWFAVGMTGILSARYVALCTGMNESQLLDNMTREERRNPIRPAALDLLHPPSISEMRPRAVPAYADAFRRRSVRLVMSLSKRGGEQAIAKTLAAVRQNPPADGAALVQLIAKATGVDLSAELGPQP